MPACPLGLGGALLLLFVSGGACEPGEEDGLVAERYWALKPGGVGSL